MALNHDIKALLENPEAAITNTWGSTTECPELESINALVTQIQALRISGKILKTEKQLCAKQFKGEQHNPDKLSQLKSEMQRISQQFTSTENLRKTSEKQLLLYFQASKSDTVQTLPLQFQKNKALAPTLGEITVIEIDDHSAKRWDAFVCASPQASIYHRYKWRELITKTFKHTSFYLLAHGPEGETVGVLPIVWMKSKLFGSFGVSLPFVNYGGPITSCEKAKQALLDKASAMVDELSWSHLEIRTTDEGGKWPCQTKKVSMIKALPNNIIELDKSLGSKIRAQVNQANKHEPRICFGGQELLNDFYRVFATNMRDLGTPVYSKQLFQNILLACDKEAHLAVTYLKHKPVACAFLLGNRELLEIPWASTLKSVNALNINMWMYRQILGFSINSGYTFFDFGRSTLDAPTYRFKKQWGAEPVKHYWYYCMANQQNVPQLNPDNPKYKLAIALWKRLPIFISKIIGPLIVRSLP